MMSRSTDTDFRWYRSKIDWWLVPLLALPPIASVVVLVATIQAGDRGELPWAIAAMVLVSAFYLGLVFPMRYGIGSDLLIVRFGLCRQKVALARIIKVTPIRNPLGSPALSLDRFKIEYGKGQFQSVEISPAHREQFLEDLASQAGLVRRGNGLERTAV
ncbi:MAG: hypothetical protein FJ295_06555 [Planctomycetes bacterium]|nr:hypothetical protein [Planctomycetota bacterium]